MNSNQSNSKLSSVAMRIHNMDAMQTFYSEAFGIHFQEVVMKPFKTPILGKGQPDA